MKCRLLFVFVVLVGNLDFAVCQTQKNTVDPKEIILKSIDAMGGESLLRSVNTLYTEMETEMDGRAVIWVTKEMMPNMGAFQILYQGRVVYEDWFNGKRGFSVSNGTVTETDQKELVDKYIRRNIFNELDFINPALYMLEYAGEANVGSGRCFKVKATSQLGDVRYLYIDNRSFFTVKEEKFRKGESNPVSVSYFSNFRKFGSLVFYSTVIMGDGPDAQKARLSKLVYNEGVSRNDFDRVK